MPIVIRHQETCKTATWASSKEESRWKGKVAHSWLRVEEGLVFAKVKEIVWGGQGSLRVMHYEWLDAAILSC